jgi:nitroreductase
MSSPVHVKGNPAPTDHPVHELIRHRWSPRAYSDRPVERRLLAQLFEAARWAPSSGNEQPWSFIFGEKGSEGYRRIFDVLVPANQEWVKSVPVLAIGLARRLSTNGAENRFAMYDLGQAVSLLIVEATALGLVVHQMAGFDKEKAGQNLSVPDAYEIASVIAIGYQGDPAQLSDKLKSRELAPRMRKPLSEFVFERTFGDVADLNSQ